MLLSPFPGFAIEQFPQMIKIPIPHQVNKGPANMSPWYTYFVHCSGVVFFKAYKHVQTNVVQWSLWWNVVLSCVLYMIPYILCSIFLVRKRFHHFIKETLYFFQLHNFLPKYHIVFSSVNIYPNIIMYFLQWFFTRIS